MINRTHPSDLACELIRVGRHHMAMVDPDVAARVREHVWWKREEFGKVSARMPHAHGCVPLHHFVLGLPFPSPIRIRHLNGNQLDNRRCNLIVLPPEWSIPKQHVKPLTDRYWSRVIKRDGCWGWKGHINSRGYGMYVTMRHLNGEVNAHRIAWALTHGPIPDGLLVCHKCDNPPCCNPDHLFLGTYQDNSDDCVAKGRQATGERHGNALLTNAQVIHIKQMLRDGAEAKSIAEQFGVHKSTIVSIKNGKHWRSV